uniref:Uncharacterized protein n=1 Tax=Rhizophora mucronata TaxID=61149 RepID=A0A2P2N814_RHIMU
MLVYSCTHDVSLTHSSKYFIVLF